MRAQRNFALDLIKVLAAIFITNSHYIPLYKDINIGLATFGVHGNALFFFAAGYLLLMSNDKRQERFVAWYKRRVIRLWPTVMLWTVIASLLFSKPFTLPRFLLADGYWFIQDIALLYIPYYIVLCSSRSIKAMLAWFTLGIIITVVYGCIMPWAEGSVFHTNLHYVCHFSVMVMGGIVYRLRDKIKSTPTKDWIFMILSFIVYFMIMALGKGKAGMIYYTQLLCLIPLHTFCYYLYKVFSEDWCDKLFSIKYIGWILLTISTLTLEIYIVQFDIITDKLNMLFPVNTIIVFVMICIVAYLVKKIVSFIMNNILRIS